MPMPPPMTVAQLMEVLKDLPPDTELRTEYDGMALRTIHSAEIAMDRGKKVVILWYE